STITSCRTSCAPCVRTRAPRWRHEPISSAPLRERPPHLAQDRWITRGPLSGYPPNPSRIRWPVRTSTRTVSITRSRRTQPNSTAGGTTPRSTRWLRRTFLMPVVYAMLRVLRESEYLRRPPGLKKFRGCYPARVISPVGGIPHAVSRCSRHDEVAGLHKSQRAIRGHRRHVLPANSERVLHIRSVRRQYRRQQVARVALASVAGVR